MLDKQTTSNRIADEYLDQVRRWFKILSQDEFNEIVEHIKSRISVYQTKIDKVGETPTLDNALQNQVYIHTKNELQSLIKHFNHMANEYVRTESKR